MLRTILTIAAVCALGWSYSRFIGYDTDYTLFMVGVDALACRVITWHPAGKWQSVIGLSYLLQIYLHFGRLIADNPDMNVYGNGLTLIAFLQLVLVAGWFGYERGLFRRRSPDNPLAIEAHSAGLDR